MMMMMMVLFPLAILLMLALSIAGFFGALMSARRSRQEMEARIALVSHGPDGASGKAVLAAGTRARDRSAELGAWLRDWFSLGLSHDWGMRAGGMALILLAIGGAAGAWLLLGVGLHVSPFLAGGAALAMFVLAPRMWLKHQQSGADQQFVTLFPDTIDMMIRMLRAGLPVTAAIRAVGTEAPAPVSLVFARMADQMAVGIPFEDTLATAAKRVGLPDFSFFAVAVGLQRTTGGNLTVTLDILSEIMRKRRAARQKGRAVTGEVRMSAYVLGAIPFLVIGAMLALSPDYMRPLITDRRGHFILAIATVSMSIGFISIRQMMRSVSQG